MVGLNNIELITDRPPEVNFKEISEVKKRFPKNAVIASLMVESKRESWHDVVKQANDSGADGIELNFGCPHGMSERGMGAAVGQVPDYACQITTWVKEVATIPVLVKLTPNVADIRYVARAAVKGGADGPVADQHDQQHHGRQPRDARGRRRTSTAAPRTAATAGRRSSRSRSTCCRRSRSDPEVGVPISGIGGHRVVAGRGRVPRRSAPRSTQVCTAAMHYGFRMVEDLVDGLTAVPRAEGPTRASPACRARRCRASPTGAT
jgi:dihydropyrimidine dehydrogenase (NAD+) subunit PreA